MADQTIPDYETIRAAVAGETWAVEKVLMCYKDEIDRQATVKKRQPDGTFKLEIDEDMRQYITMKLIEALPQFPLEEMEREEKRNRGNTLMEISFGPFLTCFFAIMFLTIYLYIIL